MSAFTPKADIVQHTGKGHTSLSRMQNPACQIRARRHQKRGVIKAGFARIVWQRITSVDQLQQGDAADAEYRNLPSVLLHGQTKHVAVADLSDGWTRYDFLVLNVG
jgi:hypothetical protein